MSDQNPVHEQLRRALRSKAPLDNTRQIAVELMGSGKSANDVVKVFQDDRSGSSLEDV